MSDQHKHDEKQEAKEEKLIEDSEHSLLEMQDAMSSMMSASTKMMQSFVDMRVSYLKLMSRSLEDPKTSFDIMSKNVQELSNAVNKAREARAQEKDDD